MEVKLVTDPPQKFSTTALHHLAVRRLESQHHATREYLFYVYFRYNRLLTRKYTYLKANKCRMFHLQNFNLHLILNPRHDSS